MLDTVNVILCPLMHVATWSKEGVLGCTAKSGMVRSGPSISRSPFNGLLQSIRSSCNLSRTVDVVYRPLVLVEFHRFRMHTESVVL